MNLLKKISVILAYLFGVIGMYAQVSFQSVANQKSISLGDPLEVSFILSLEKNAEVESINYPSFSGFKLVGKSSSTQINFINGKRSKQNIETLILRPEKKGNLKIGEAEIKVDGQTYTTAPITITVTDRPKDDSQNNSLVFLKLELSENQVYPNQGVLATLKVYAKSYDAIRRRSEVQAPTVNYFQVKEIPQKSSQREIQQEIYNQQTYVSEEVGKYLLFPQKTGELEIPSFTIRVAIPLDFFDEKILELQSQPQSIRVKNLPGNAPKSFTGAVGDFQFSVYAQKSNLTQNEAFSVEVEAIGEGNLSYIDLPSLELAPELEVYKPKRINSVIFANTTEKGKITDRYVVVPQFGGEYVVPSLQFTYFDPKKEEYITLTSNAQNLQISGTPQQYFTQKNALDSSSVAVSTTDSIALKSEERESTTKNLKQGMNDFISKVLPSSDKNKDSNQTNEKTSSSWWTYTLLGGTLCTALLASLFFLFKKKKETSEEAVNCPVSITKNKLNKELQKLEKLSLKGEKKAFTAQAQLLLQHVVCYLSKENKIYCEQESKEILTQKSPLLEEKWSKAYMTLQEAQYAGNSDTLSLEKDYPLYCEIVNLSIK